MILILLTLVTSAAHAYIPEYSLITSHAADQHGKGTYLIEQEVTYRKNADAFSVKETWLVANENKMRLTLEGRGALKNIVQGTILFDGGQRLNLDSSGRGVRSQRLGEDWLEPLFFMRSSKSLRARLVALKVAPPESLHDRATLSTDGPSYQPPSFLRLSRVGGAIAWAIGMPATSTLQPTLWLEQDQFVLRKFRGANQNVLKADNYAKFEDGLWFPRQRSYTFGSYTVDVVTLQVRSLGKQKPGDARFESRSLSSAHDALKEPEVDGLKEFYARFR